MSMTGYDTRKKISHADRTRAWDSRRQPLGLFLVALSAAAIAVVPTFAHFAYDGGSDTLTVITVRSVVTAIACFLVLALLGRPLTIGRRALGISLTLGMLYAIHLYGLLGAVHYLPVNMVLLIFYLHPLMIGVIAILAGREAMRWASLGSLMLALAGLGLAIGFSFGDLNVFGAALALMAAVLAAVVIVGGSHAMKNCDSLAVTCYMMLSAAVTLAIALLVQGAPAWPSTLSGWTGFTGVSVAYTVGTVAFFAAIPFLGTVRAAMVSNLEPVLGILFAMVVLGEHVSVLQGLGIVMVIGAIFAMEVVRRPARP